MVKIILKNTVFGNHLLKKMKMKEKQEKKMVFSVSYV